MSESEPAPPNRGGGGSQGPPASIPKRRYGRRRGTVAAGNQFVSRLGPAGSEPFASIDDPVEATAPRPTPDTPVEALRFVALDCETTGQSPHELVELGAVAFTLEKHLLSFETLVHSNDRINPYARRIHGITAETLHGAPHVARVVARFRRFVQGSVLVEHSADAFDTRLIARTVGAELDADNVDTTRLAARLWGLRDTIGLERLCERLGVTHRRPHHALADAEATAACFVALLRLGRDRFGWNTLADLLADGQPPLLRDPDQAFVRERDVRPARRSLNGR
jgi:DNA polymerase III epsilon subunit-like protein